MRKKLIELLTHESSPLFMVFGDNVEGLADYLIANGVTIPTRCKDCNHFGHNLENDTYCRCTGGLDDPEENDFCSYGERKDYV